MRIVQINTVPNLSTGTVMLENHKRYVAEGHESWRIWGRGREAENEYEFKFGTDLGVKIDVLETRLFGRAGFHSKRATERLLAKLDEIKPDLVHLHNLHGYYLNVEMLFEWLASADCQVEWTLHDCWAFTGHCAHFTYAKCFQWKNHCAGEGPCCQLDTYPKTFSKSSCKWSYAEKKRLFTLLPAERMVLITPSKWLAGLTRESFLAKYSVEVRYNTIDTKDLCPTPSDFRERYGLQGRFVVLGVASAWSERKGLSDFVRLANELDEHFAVVLVGLSKKQIKHMPGNVVARSEAVCAEEAVISHSDAETFVGFDASRATVGRCRKGCLTVCFGRTDSKRQLAALYSMADLFFNPTYEDNYPTVNLEAEACGLPVGTYDTGGCRETISLEKSVTLDGYDEAFAYLEHYACRKGQGAFGE